MIVGYVNKMLSDAVVSEFDYKVLMIEVHGKKRWLKNRLRVSDPSLSIASFTTFL